MMITRQQTVQNSQDKNLKIQQILEKLRQRDSELFNGIINAIHKQDNYTSKVLAREVVEIRKTIVTIENIDTDIPNHSQCLGLILCPRCYSPEISLSQSDISLKCLCLDCGKIWINEMDNTEPKWIENVWSLV